MHEITIRVYENGTSEFAKFFVNMLTTITGDEDQFAYACDSANFIARGIKWAKRDARVDIVKVELNM